jgi:hypothetical protein
MTRQEREKIVLDLYYNQGKNIREIAQEARMSFRDIGTILNKADEGREQNNNNDIENKKRQQEQEQQVQQLSLSTQAYKLFSEGKSPIQAICRRFENNNEEYLKINQTVKDKVSSILSDGKGLLRLSLYSLIESIRNEPVKYSSLIYYHNNNNISLPGTTHYPASSMYGGQQRQQYILSQDYFIEHYTTMLIEEAEKLYNKLVKEITEGITYDPAFSGSSTSSSSSPLLSPSSDGTTTKSLSSTPPKSTAQ